MRETRIIMGMPVTIEIVGKAQKQDIEEIFAFFVSIDDRFSPFKETSEVMQINRKEIAQENYSPEMREILFLAEKTKKETRDYFNVIRPDGFFDPSGIVKGLAIQKAAEALLAKGYENFALEVGGDIQTHGKNASGNPWKVGIRNPFNRSETIKTIAPNNSGVATSGTYIRGQHIYNPHEPGKKLEEIVSLTVVAPNILEADRFATAAFAMGNEGIHFIESLPSCEGYAVNLEGIATMTSGLDKFVVA